jgi:ribosomal protein S15P/S13E
MIEDLSKLEPIVRELHSKNYEPSHIGNILRDVYLVKVKKLCRVFPFLDQKKHQLKQATSKQQRLKEHLKKNRKDIPAARALVKITCKVNNQRLKYK